MTVARPTPANCTAPLTQAGAAMRDEASHAKLYREFGDRWEIEQIPAGTRWIAVQREGGDYIRLVAANGIDTLRFRMTEAERETPEERDR